MSSEISILLVDDHAIVREGLRTLLAEESDLRVVGEAASGEEAVRLATELSPDLVLLDLRLPDHDGIETADRLRSARPDTRVIMLTASMGEEMRVREAVEAGVVGYLLKDIRKEDLVRAIRDGVAGRATLHPEAQADLMQATAQARQPHDDLTDRERDVLALIGEGLSNKKIAGRLYLSEGTVKGYVSIILSKLGVDDRTQAALYAVKHKLV